MNLNVLRNFSSSKNVAHKMVVLGFFYQNTFIRIILSKIMLVNVDPILTFGGISKNKYNSK